MWNEEQGFRTCTHAQYQAMLAAVALAPDHFGELEAKCLAAVIALVGPGPSAP
jgi:hypothetical protein